MRTDSLSTLHFRRTGFALVAVAAAALTATFLHAQAVGGVPSVDITEYGSFAVAQGITAGPDGAVWFTDRSAGKIGRISVSGQVSEFTLPNSAAQPYVITAGPDGALWFTEIMSNKIGRITTDGTITEFPLPSAGASPQGITAGPDGALWFTQAAGRIGRITTAGTISEFTLAQGHDPTSIATGPDGALWFTEWAANKIGRITTAGSVTEFDIATAGAGPASMTLGPDGALWFVEGDRNKIARITTAGVITEYTVPTPGARPVGITAGPDGALWFTEGNSVKIGRITTAGAFTEYTLPGGTHPFFITVGPDGAIWFAEYTKIGRAQLPRSRTGVLSHIAVGGQWSTVITLVNNATVTAPVTVALRNDDGSAMTLPLTVTQQGAEEQLTASSVSAAIAPNATLLISMTGGASETVGWAEVLSPGPVCGFAIFRASPQGDKASEGTVLLQNQFASTLTVPFEHNGGFIMGVALANLSSAQATVTATVWDESGKQVGTPTTFPVAANGHQSFALPAQVALTGGRRGIVRFQSSVPGGLAGIGLRFSPFGTFTSVPMM